MESEDEQYLFIPPTLPTPQSPGQFVVHDDDVVIDDHQDQSTSRHQGTGKRCAGEKPRDVIWGFFEEVTTEQGSGRSTKLQKCLTCGQKVSAKADRLRAHFAKCKSKQGTPKIKTQKYLDG